MIARMIVAGAPMARLAVVRTSMYFFLRRSWAVCSCLRMRSARAVDWYFLSVEF